MIIRKSQRRDKDLETGAISDIRSLCIREDGTLACIRLDGQLYIFEPDWGKSFVIEYNNTSFFMFTEKRVLCGTGGGIAIPVSCVYVFNEVPRC